MVFLMLSISCDMITYAHISIYLSQSNAEKVDTYLLHLLCNNDLYHFRKKSSLHEFAKTMLATLLMYFEKMEGDFGEDNIICVRMKTIGKNCNITRDEICKWGNQVKVRWNLDCKGAVMQVNELQALTNKNAAAITQLTETVTILADQVENLEQVMHTLGNKFDEALTLARSSEDHMLKLGNRFDEALSLARSSEDQSSEEAEIVPQKRPRSHTPQMASGSSGKRAASTNTNAFSKMTRASTSKHRAKMEFDDIRNLQCEKFLYNMWSLKLTIADLGAILVDPRLKSKSKKVYNYCMDNFATENDVKIIKQIGNTTDDLTEGQLDSLRVLAHQFAAKLHELYNDLPKTNSLSKGHVTIGKFTVGSAVNLLEKLKKENEIGKKKEAY